MFPVKGKQTVALLCALTPVIPEVIIDDVSAAKPLAKALISGGLPVFEVSLHMPAALEIIAEMADVPDTRVGAGPLMRPSDVHAVKAAGASFGVSAMPTVDLLRASELANLSLLPTATSEEDAEQLKASGYAVQKLSPTFAAAGANKMKRFCSTAPQIRFIPASVASLEKAREYLLLSNVICVSGGWVTPQKLIFENNWDAITALAKVAAFLRR